MGGAFTAFADDATALYFNPAGLADAEPQVQVGGEFIVGPRTYTPVAPNDQGQKTLLLSPSPVAGVLGRFTGEDDQPSRVTLGAGVWNTFGGKLSYPKTGMPAFDALEDLVIETTGGAAVRVSDKLSIGAAVRVGLGLFSTSVTQKPFDAELSASGVGVGGTTGVIYKPTEMIQIGVAYRTKMSISTTGSGSVAQIPGSTPIRTGVTREQHWPQSASLGLGLRPKPFVKLAAQVDWAGWSTIQDIVVVAEALGTSGVQRFPENWRDTWAVRLGGEVQVTSSVALRGGTYIDTSAVPDRTIERQYYDTLKYGFATGASVTYNAWRFDVALDGIVAPARTVPDNTVETTNFPADRNTAPGTYSGTLVTFELTAAYRF